MLPMFWNKCDSMVTPSAFYLLHTITNFLFPHDPTAISLSHVVANPLQMVSPLFVQTRNFNMKVSAGLKA